MSVGTINTLKTVLWLVIGAMAILTLFSWMIISLHFAIKGYYSIDIIAGHLPRYDKTIVKNDAPMADTSFLDLLETISDSRFRVSKLLGNTKLGPISMWVAIPSTDSIVAGASWYTPLWRTHQLGGTNEVDDLISISPCKSSDVFIQIGAHLGIYPLVATYRGCRGIAVEAIPAAANFSRMSAFLNNWDSSRFLSINAAAGSQLGSVWFDPQRISISTNNNDTKNKLRVPMLTLDDVNELYVLPSRSQITLVVIDVERHEQAVILGSKALIQRKSVAVFQIEVWTSHSLTGPIKDFSGIQLLMDNGYRIYSTAVNLNMSHSSCDEVSDLSDLVKIINGGSSCLPSSNPHLDCLAEVYAIRADIPPLRDWYSACSQQP